MVSRHERHRVGVIPDTVALISATPMSRHWMESAAQHAERGLKPVVYPASWLKALEKFLPVFWWMTGVMRWWS